MFKKGDSVKAVRVTEFYVEPSILFKCLFCGVANMERRHGDYHMDTGSHCDNCQAPYVIHWTTPPEQSTIEMTKPQAQEPIDLSSQRTKKAMADLAASSDVLEGDLSNGLEPLSPSEDE